MNYESDLRTYVRRYVTDDKIVEDILASTREELETLDEITTPIAYGVAYRFLSPYLPQMSYETLAVITAMRENGDDGEYKGGTPEEIRDFLAGFFFDYHLMEDKPYHPVMQHVDLTAVDWMQVALAVTA